MPSAKKWLELAGLEVAKLNYEELIDRGILLSEDRFIPVITYPPVTMYPETDPEAIFSQDQNAPELPKAVYVHIPFCASSCHYCHWVKKIAPAKEEIDDYLGTLALDMDLTTRHVGTDRIKAYTVLFGGGTPSLLSPDQLERVLKDFTAHVDLSDCRQFSFEVEPASILGEEGFRSLKFSGTSA